MSQSQLSKKLLDEIVAEEIRGAGPMRRGSSYQDVLSVLKDAQYAYEANTYERLRQLDAEFARKLDSYERLGLNLDDERYLNAHDVLSEAEIEATLGRNRNYGMRVALFRAPKIEYPKEDPRQLVTSFKLDVWKNKLAEYGLLSKHQHILNLIENGFPLGVDWELTKSIIHRHHSSAIREPEAIEKYIEKETLARRYSRPYNQRELENLIGPFYCSPMGTVDKTDKPGKKRVIHDDTFPGEKNPRALNTHVVYAEDSYSWLPFDEMAQHVKRAPMGTRACAFDGEAAYRMCATRLEDQRFTIIEWKGQFRVDRAPHFGGKNAGVPHGQVADVLHDIIRAKWANAITGKWQDDHLIIQFPSSFFPWRLGFELRDIIQLTDELGYLTNRDKDQEFTEIITYLGFQWNFRERTVALTEKKQQAYMESLDDVLVDQPHIMSLEDLVELTGQLTHTCQVFPLGRGRLRSFYDEISRRGGYGASRSKKLKETQELEEATVTDMKWWRGTLQANKPMLLKDIPDISTQWEIYTDASSDWGIGVVINHEWDRWRLADNWQLDGMRDLDGMKDFDGRRNIGWAEGIAAEVAVHVLFNQFRIPEGTHIRIWCDNKGFVHSWQRGSSRNWDQNKVIVRVLQEVSRRNCHMTLEYIRGTDNLADAPSRGKELPIKTRAAWGGKAIPEHLKEWLIPGA